MLIMECWQEFKNKSGSFKSMPHINIKWKTHDTLTSMQEVYSLHDAYFAFSKQKDSWQIIKTNMNNRSYQNINLKI